MRVVIFSVSRAHITENTTHVIISVVIRSFIMFGVYNTKFLPAQHYENAVVNLIVIFSV